MIQFFYENLPESVSTDYKKWLEDLILSEGKKTGEINYIFCDDEYLLKINQDYLQHDYYTDIITFDYVKGKTISAEIFVSLQRISDNASTLSRDYEEELRRVLAHGILHLAGYKDKTEEEEKEMRRMEDLYLDKYRDLKF
ncbi:rRNA maturation RNase YbeY [Chryseobacterium sp. ES2]|jgi:rRNA maturation RNase YbeY|uniref:Endoribonuclease YbeY n=2 Tax=Chryseobacterium TaxID=59732 RepID=A0ABU1EBA4_9FLAO|nr:MULTISPECIES: rRNA maturation RNase YbeY [Chryseobacterium]MDR4955108.1 rRNA maturation RNase YbeY [Chryseobacterium sp. ES2]MDR6459790.1 rRNA maturation RNase YbeY [Chryseobacterium vietnamense]MDR6488173.1 rRNA maturation RNase YbeY [Chryseobacterium vietnamense]